jgi:hypothetical protein
MGAPSSSTIRRAEWNGVLRIEEHLDALALHGRRNGQLVPGDDGSRGEGHLLHARFAVVGADQSGIPVEENELMAAAEVQERAEELPRVYPDTAVVLVIVAQHDSNAHEFTPPAS